MREQIALAIAEMNRCDYCLAVPNYLGENLDKLGAEGIKANHCGASSDAKTTVAVSFAVKIAKNRGQVSDTYIQDVRDEGYSGAEIVGIVALNTLTNYINEVLGTETDFPTVNTFAA